MERANFYSELKKSRFNKTRCYTYILHRNIFEKYVPKPEKLYKKIIPGEDRKNIIIKIHLNITGCRIKLNVINLLIYHKFLNFK